MLMLLKSGIWQSDFRGVDLSEDQAKEILRTMIPIETTMTDERMLSDADIEYRFSMQSGRDPLEFEIKIDGEKLVFQEYFSVHYDGKTYLYKGGSAPDFLEVIQSYLPRPEVVSPPENTATNGQTNEN